MFSAFMRSWTMLQPVSRKAFIQLIVTLYYTNIQPSKDRHNENTFNYICISIPLYTISCVRGLFERQTVVYSYKEVGWFWIRKYPKGRKTNLIRMEPNVDESISLDGGVGGEPSLFWYTPLGVRDICTLPSAALKKKGLIILFMHISLVLISSIKRLNCK